MSVTGISVSFFSYDHQSIPRKQPPPMIQEFKQEFDQLGEDLQSGNLSAAQADFAALQQLEPKGISDPTIHPNNPLSKLFTQLAHDLQAADLSAAQRDYSFLQKAFQHVAAHKRDHYGEVATQIRQALQVLGKALQAGDLASAQKAFAVLKKDLQKLAQSPEDTSQPSPAAPAPPSTGSVSVTA